MTGPDRSAVQSPSRAFDAPTSSGRPMERHSPSVLVSQSEWEVLPGAAEWKSSLVASGKVQLVTR